MLSKRSDQLDLRCQLIAQGRFHEGEVGCDAREYRSNAHFVRRRTLLRSRRVGVLSSIRGRGACHGSNVAAGCTRVKGVDIQKHFKNKRLPRFTKGGAKRARTSHQDSLGTPFRSSQSIAWATSSMGTSSQSLEFIDAGDLEADVERDAGAEEALAAFFREACSR